MAKTKEELLAISIEVRELLKAKGVRASLIAIGDEDGKNPGHSAYIVNCHGPCLDVEGLSCRVRHYALCIWEGKVMVESPSPFPIIKDNKDES